MWRVDNQGRSFKVVEWAYYVVITKEEIKFAESMYYVLISNVFKINGLREKKI